MPHPFPYIIAHRGASLEAPENTLASIKRALALKSHYVEVDVRLSKEGIPILLHDDSAARMLGTSYAPFIHDLTLSQIQTLDIGHFFHPKFEGELIPSLAQALQLDWGETGLMLEIKECFQQPDLLVKEVFRVLQEAPSLPSSLVIGSFSPAIMQEVRKWQPLLPVPVCMIGIIEESEMLSPFLQQTIPHLALWHPLITPELLTSLHARQIDVWAFTIDDFQIAKSLVSLGVSGIISNNSELMMRSYENLAFS